MIGLASMAHSSIACCFVQQYSWTVSLGILGPVTPFSTFEKCSRGPSGHQCDTAGVVSEVYDCISEFGFEELDPAIDHQHGPNTNVLLKVRYDLFGAALNLQSALVSS
jgi:hypothetical protein